jgi:hypothetical protein
MPGKRSQSSMMTTVQDFYERYPYPRPIDDLEKYRRLWQDGERRRADFHLFWPTRRYREDFSILIAGCGRPRPPRCFLWLACGPRDRIDFSATSVRTLALSKIQLGIVRGPVIERMANVSADQITVPGFASFARPLVQSKRSACLQTDGARLPRSTPPYRAGIYMLRVRRRLELPPMRDS